MLVVFQLYGWSYAQAEDFVNDSLILRKFCRVYFENVPDDTTLLRWTNTLGPETNSIEEVRAGSWAEALIVLKMDRDSAAGALSASIGFVEVASAGLGPSVPVREGVARFERVFAPRVVHGGTRGGARS